MNNRLITLDLTYEVGKYKIGVCYFSLNIPVMLTSHCTVAQSGFISLKRSENLLVFLVLTILKTG